MTPIKSNINEDYLNKDNHDTLKASYKSKGIEI